MAKWDLFGVSTFPVFAAYANGRSLGYLVNYRESDSWQKDAASINVPILGKRKIPVGEFIAGVVSIVISFFALLPVQDWFMGIFFENFSMGEKWPTYVVVCSMVSIIAISFISGCKLVFRSVKKSKSELSSENARKTRDKKTVDNLTR
jgi:hypothetical protein